MDISLFDNWRVETWETDERVAIMLSMMESIDFKGKRVLDLGSHFGKFSYASYHLGAASILGIEQCQAKVYHSTRFLVERLVPFNQFRFVYANYLDYPWSFPDIILAFGIFYHHNTDGQSKLVELIKDAHPEYVLLETMFADTEDVFTLDHPTDYGETLTVPTYGYVRRMFQDAGYDLLGSQPCTPGRLICSFVNQVSSATSQSPQATSQSIAMV